MLTYYHGTDSKFAAKIQKRINLQVGGQTPTELGLGFYIGSSAWRAHSWAWQKGKQNAAVFKFEIDEVAFLKLRLLCMNRRATQNDFLKRKATPQGGMYVYPDVDAVWAPIVGKNVKDAYQIKFQGGATSPGALFINQQRKTRIV